MWNWYRGADDFGAFLRWVFRTRGRQWRTVPLWANGEAGFAAYASGELRTVAILTVEAGWVTRMTVYEDELDGVVEDPDGSGGTPRGGWAFRVRPKGVAADDFKLGSIFDTGVLLMGRTTWQVFSRRWPNRSDSYADAMNHIPKVVVSRSAPALDAWTNSSLLEGDLVAGVAELTRERDVVVVGSTSVVHALAAADAVDEYRLLVIPTASERVSDCSSGPSTCTSRRSRPWVRQSWNATTAPLARNARRWRGR